MLQHIALANLPIIGKFLAELVRIVEEQSVIKGSMNKAVYFIWSAVLLGVDQAIKHVVRLMPEGEPFFRCPPLFELERVTSTGGAFSLWHSRQGIVVLLPAALMLLLCVYQGA